MLMPRNVTARTIGRCKIPTSALPPLMRKHVAGVSAANCCLVQALVCMHIHTHPSVHTYVHTHIHTYLHTCHKEFRGAGPGTNGDPAGAPVGAPAESPWGHRPGYQTGHQWGHGRGCRHQQGHSRDTNQDTSLEHDANTEYNFPVWGGPPTCLHAFTHACVHARIRTRTHVYINTYVRTCMEPLCVPGACVLANSDFGSRLHSKLWGSPVNILDQGPLPFWVRAQSSLDQGVPRRWMGGGEGIRR